MGETLGNDEGSFHLVSYFLRIVHLVLTRSPFLVNFIGMTVFLFNSCCSWFEIATMYKAIIT
jgi:hypothetical protein